MWSAVTSEFSADVSGPDIFPIYFQKGAEIKPEPAVFELEVSAYAPLLALVDKGTDS